MTKEQLNAVIAAGHVQGSKSEFKLDCWFVPIERHVAKALPDYIDLEDGTEVAVVYSQHFGETSLCIPNRPGDKSNIIIIG